MKPYLLPLFLRDLSNFQQLIEQLEGEEQLWATKEGVTNPVGSLALHVAGNLQHFVGAVMGHTGYQRRRELEFGDRESSRRQVVEELERTKQTLQKVLSQISAQQLQQALGVEVLNRSWTNEEFLLHLYGHLNYHLGQANYLARLL